MTFGGCGDLKTFYKCVYHRNWEEFPWVERYKLRQRLAIRDMEKRLHPLSIRDRLNTGPFMELSLSAAVGRDSPTQSTASGAVGSFISTTSAFLAMTNHDHAHVTPTKMPTGGLARVRHERSEKDFIRVSGSIILVKILRAMAARALFIVHSLATVWAAIEVTHKESIWSFALITLGIVVEGSYAIIMRAGDERKWFSPSVFLYILSTAPPIWILETKLCEWRTVQNVSQLHDKIHLQLLEQVMLCVLIVGRWLLPKGEISREQLSQILLAYLAISSDIVEFFDVFKEKIVYRNKYIQYMVLAAWTSSLLQFPFVLTVSRARKMRVAITNEEMPIKTKPHLWQAIYDVDLWAIILANSLQDIPFFVVRLYLITRGLLTYTMMFFISKNALIIVLQTYRAFVLLNDRYWNPHYSPIDPDHRLMKKRVRRRKHKNVEDSERVPIYSKREQRSYGGTPNSKSPHRRKLPPIANTIETIEE